MENTEEDFCFECRRSAFHRPSCSKDGVVTAEDCRPPSADDCRDEMKLQFRELERQLQRTTCAMKLFRQALETEEEGSSP